VCVPAQDGQQQVLAAAQQLLAMIPGSEQQVVPCTPEEAEAAAAQLLGLLQGAQHTMLRQVAGPLLVPAYRLLLAGCSRRFSLQVGAGAG
jgi:hypothetical protein